MNNNNQDDRRHAVEHELNRLRMRAAAFETGQAALIANADMRIVKVNDAFTRITGYRPGEVIGQTPKMFQSGRHSTEFYADMWRLLQDTGHWQGEIWNRNKRGDIYPVWQSITAVRRKPGEVRHYVSLFHDIAERKSVEKVLAEEAMRDHLTGAANRRTFDRQLISAVKAARERNAEVVLMFLDIDHFKLINDRHGHAVGDHVLYALAQLVQRRLRKGDLFARWGGEEFALLLLDTPLKGARRLAERLRDDIERAAMPKPGMTVSIGLTAYQVDDTARSLIQRADVALYRAKSNGRNRVEWLEKHPLERGQAVVPLSAKARCMEDFAGHSQLTQRLAEAWRAARERGGTLTICALDVDHFSAVNEQLGRQRSEQVMRLLGRRLVDHLGADDQVVRTGGDEFVLLLTDSGDDAMLNRLLNRLRQPMVLDRHRVALTASLGVASYPADSAGPDRLLRHAQQAMFRAKQAGRNLFLRFDPGLDRELQHCQAQRQRIEQAIHQGELRLHFQPQVDMARGEVVGLEALVRWQHPDQGLLAPMEFLPLIEGTPLERTLGEWVLGEVMRQLVLWGEQGHQLPVSVNISPAHLLAPDFVASLAALLAKTPEVLPAWLNLEVLETAAMQDIAQAIEVISQCQALGVRVAIDDFGTGFSSLTYLRQLPVDLIKVDKSFVSDMLSDSSDRAIVESVIYMARRFGRDLLAEGVESLEHATALLELGCELAQGYGIARPMPADALEAWMTEWPQRSEWQQLVSSTVG